MSGAALDAVAALARSARTLAWFGAAGLPLTDADRAAATRYLAGLGLVTVPTGGVATWPAAKLVADAPDWDPAWWDAEERQRIALLATATARHGRDRLLGALTEVARGASERAHERALAATAAAGVADEALARAAAGAASQAAYLAALAVADEAGVDHPFRAKFELFEAGRWPLGVVGGCFRLL